MLRRKLFIMLIALTGLLLALAIIMLIALQNLYSDLDHINTDAMELSNRAWRLGTHISQVEVEAHRLNSGQTRHVDDLIDSVELLESEAAAIGRHYVTAEPGVAEIYDDLMQRIPALKACVGAVATAKDPELSQHYILNTLEATTAMRGRILLLAEHSHDHVQHEQMAVSTTFRWLVIGMGLGFLVVLNTTILLQIRTARIVLDPVDRLVAASRALAEGNFDHRVDVGQHDEFEELATAFNHLAEQLQQTEQRRLEMIGQVAVTLNHELNNSLAIIQLQLRRLQRQSQGDEAVESRLREIRESLERMVEVVDALKHVRRIVLTDYVAGTKMLDLKRSAEADDPAARPPSASGASRLPADEPTATE